MKKMKVIILVTFLISIFSNFTVLAQEGLGALKYTDTDRVWVYIQEDGTKLTSQWKYTKENWYYFDENGESKQNTWAEINRNWYYFDNFSRMLHDTTTPDGYTVGSDGAWVKDGQVVVETVVNK